MPNKGVTSTTAETTTAEAEVLYESRVPFYGTIIIAAAGCFLLVCCCFWMCLRLCQKKPKQAKGLLKTKGASPSVLRESIQPDLEGGDEIDGMPKFVGKLHFTVEYTRSTCSLTVNVIEAHELAAMDLGGSSDPYIKVRLLPNKKPIFTTKMVKESLNPLFNETFTFEVLPEQLQMRTLQFQIFDYDLLSANDRIGSVTVPLSELDLSKLVDEWRDLVKAGEDTCDVADIPGDICVSLRYVAAASLLTVVVIEAKNVPMNDDGNDTGE